MRKKLTSTAFALLLTLLLMPFSGSAPVEAAAPDPEPPAGLSCVSQVATFTYASGWPSIRCNTLLPVDPDGDILFAYYSQSSGQGPKMMPCTADAGGFVCQATSYGAWGGAWNGFTLAWNTTTSTSGARNYLGGETKVGVCPDFCVKTATAQYSYPAPFLSLVGGPSPACETVSYGARLRDVDYLMGLANVAEPPVVLPGDRVLIVVEFDDDVGLTPGSFRWRPTAADSFAPMIIQDIATLPGVVAVTYWVTYTATANLADLELWCSHETGDSYRRFGDVDWQGTPTVSRACAALRLTMPKGDPGIGVRDVVASAVLPAGNYTGGDVGVNVQTRGFPSVSRVSTTRFGVVVGGVPPALFDIPVDFDGSVRFVDINFDEEILGLEYLSVNCTDSYGTLKLDTTGAVYVYDPDAPGGTDSGYGFEGCFDGSGIGLNPASWLPAGGRMAVCVVRGFVVPTPEAMAYRFERFSALTGEPPVQWADEGITYVTDASLSFAPWSEAGPACATVMDTAICPRDWDQAGLIPSNVVTIMMFGLWSAIVFAVWRWL